VLEFLGKLGFDRILKDPSADQTSKQQDGKAVEQRTRRNGSEGNTEVQQFEDAALKGGESKKPFGRTGLVSDSLTSSLMKHGSSSGISNANAALINRVQLHRTRNHLLFKPGEKWFAYRVSSFCRYLASRSNLAVWTVYYGKVAYFDRYAGMAYDNMPD
jgi:hypothetical protein